jgi:hypothetical protein
LGIAQKEEGKGVASEKSGEAKGRLTKHSAAAKAEGEGGGGKN